MSETLSSVEFNNTVTSREAMQAVADEGAIAIHDFAPLHLLQRAANVLQSAEMYTDANAEGGKVDRHHDLVHYGFSADHPWPVATSNGGYAPEPLFAIAKKVSDFVTASPDVRWNANEITGHRYNPNDFINRHRDYATALGYVAVLTLEGSQDFFFERDNGDDERVTMKPGTLTIMRGNQPENEKKGPFHWVAPATERRLAVSVREMAKHWDR